MITITKVGLKRLKTSGKYCSTDVDINVNIPTYDETITSIYSITSTCTHCTASGSNPTSIETGTTATLTFTAESGYVLPDNITIVGATGVWAQATGTLVLSNATSNASVTITAEPQIFTITNNLTNCSKSSGPTTITYGTTATLVYSANDGCTLPDSVIVVGASYTWTKETGTLILSSPIANIGITIKAINQLEVPLCFTANTAGSTVTLNKEGSPAWAGSYSIDGTTWNTYIPGTTGAITLANIGDKVYFKGDITAHFSDSNYLQFSMTGSIAAAGNINSMYVSTGFENLTTLLYNYCYSKLFLYCEVLTSAPLLPATTLSNYCYFAMLIKCTSLTTAPALPATTLASYCYQSMFANCPSLTTLPALPATTLANSCYGSMFYNCTSLQVNDSSTAGVAEQAWRIPTSGTFTNAYLQLTMFTGCAGTRSENSPTFTAGTSATYYTQNAPV